MVAADPKPRLVLAVPALVRSERLLAFNKADVSVPAAEEALAAALVALEAAAVALEDALEALVAAC